MIVWYMYFDLHLVFLGFFYITTANLDIKGNLLTIKNSQLKHIGNLVF